MLYLYHYKIFIFYRKYLYTPFFYFIETFWKCCGKWCMCSWGPNAPLFIRHSHFSDTVPILVNLSKKINSDITALKDRLFKSTFLKSKCNHFPHISMINNWNHFIMHSIKSCWRPCFRKDLSLWDKQPGLFSVSQKSDTAAPTERLFILLPVLF